MIDTIFTFRPSLEQQQGFCFLCGAKLDEFRILDVKHHEHYGVSRKFMCGLEYVTTDFEETFDYRITKPCTGVSRGDAWMNVNIKTDDKCWVTNDHIKHSKVR